MLEASSIGNGRSEMFIIAEIGNNHEGDIEYAKDAIVAASESGADAVKFQAIRARQLVNAQLRPQRAEVLEGFEFTIDQYGELYSCARDRNVQFGLSFFDSDTCSQMDVVDFAKIASSDHDNEPLIRSVLERYSRVIISTGMMSGDSSRRLNQAINDRPDVILMHCVSMYPTAVEDASLDLIDDLSALGHPVGYSDHTDDLFISLLALAKGCRYFEKHFTLSKTGGTLRDHSLSSTPDEFRAYCSMLRKYEQAVTRMSLADRPEFRSDDYLESRQSVYLTRTMDGGEVIESKDLVLQRPRLSDAFHSVDQVLGRKLNSRVERGKPILIEDLS